MTRFKNQLPPQKENASPGRITLLNAVESGSLLEVDKAFLSNVTEEEALKRNDQGLNIFEIAVARGNVFLVERLIEGLQDKNSKALEDLLLLRGDPAQKSKKLPITIAAERVIDPRMYQLLLKQAVGYSFQDLEKVKTARQGWKGVWGAFCVFVGAFLKSACPSKSFADAFNIHEMLLGFGFAVGTGILASIAWLPFAIALSGFLIISVGNFRKIWVEQAAEKDLLNKNVLLAQLNNFRKKLEKPLTTPLQEEAKEEFQALGKKAKRLQKMIAQKGASGQTKARELLTTKDKIWSSISMLGDILCTNFGLAGFALTLTAATATPLVIALPLLVAVLGITSFYYVNRKRETAEMAEHRRAESDLDKKVYKSFKNFSYQAQGLAQALQVLGDNDHFSQAMQSIFTLPKEGKPSLIARLFRRPSKVEQYALKREFKRKQRESIEELTAEQKTQGLYLAMATGNPKGLKPLLTFRNFEVPRPESIPSNKTTPLHSAAKKGHLFMFEELLGKSVRAEFLKTRKDRKTKPFWEIIKKADATVTEERYKALKTLSLKMLKTPDEKGLLPLHYAASLRDPSLYRLLLDQKKVIYTPKQLEEALKLRLLRTQKEKKWSVLNAMAEAICPANVSEIVSSICFAGLTATALGSGLAFAAISFPLVFVGVAVSNYYKTKYERNLKQVSERLSVDGALLRGLSSQLQELNQDDPTAIQAFENKLAFFKANRPWLARVEKEPKKFKPTDFIRKIDYLRIFGTTSLSLLCAYAGTLGFVELGASAFAVAIAGPVAWGIGAGIFLLFSAFYLMNQYHELKIFSENRQSSYEQRTAQQAKVIALEQSIATLHEERTPKGGNVLKLLGQEGSAPKSRKSSFEAKEVKNEQNNLYSWEKTRRPSKEASRSETPDLGSRAGSLVLE